MSIAADAIGTVSMLPRCMSVLIRAAHQHSLRARCPANIPVRDCAAPQGHCWPHEHTFPPAHRPRQHRVCSQLRCPSAPPARRLRGRQRFDDGSGLRCESVGSRPFHAAAPQLAGAALPHARLVVASELVGAAAQTQLRAADAGTAAAAASANASAAEFAAGQQEGQQRQHPQQHPALLHDFMLTLDQAKGDVRRDREGVDPAQNDELRPRQASTC